MRTNQRGFSFFIILLPLAVVMVASVVYFLSKDSLSIDRLPDQTIQEAEKDNVASTVVTVAKKDSPSCGSILLNGKPSAKLNFVFISDGFIDKNKFLKSVEDFTGVKNISDKFAFLNYRPYNELKNDFNFFTFFDPAINWGCDSTIDLKKDSLCLTEHTVYDTLSKYCSWTPEADLLIMLSNKSYRASASHYLPEEFKKLHIVRIPLDTETNLEKADNARNSVLVTFLHELGHALGDLSDEYIDFGNEGFKPIAGIGASNIDSEGCSTWCSGKLNTQSPAYGKYAQYKSCTTGLDVNAPSNTEQFKMCFLQATKSDGSDLPPPEMDMGNGCYQGAGCFWTAGGTNGFRSTQNSLMRSGVPDGNTPPELGSFNEKLVKETVENKVRQREKNISTIKLKILSIKNSDFPLWWLNANVYQRDPQPLPFKIEFVLLDQKKEEITFSTNDRNYVIASDKGIISRNLGTNKYEVLYAHYLNTKQGQTTLGENDYIDITFNIIHNKIKVQETYRFYLKKLNFVKIK